MKILPMNTLRMKTLALWPCVLVLAGCGAGQRTAEPPKRPVPLVHTAPAVRRDLTRKMMFTGSVEPVRVARIASPAEGPIVDCAVREGDAVTTGQLLAKVGRSRIADTALEAAQEDLRVQESELQRVEQLVKSGALPAKQLDEARARLEASKARVAAMETGADDYEIRAPWTGVVSRVWIAEGNYVSPRTPLVEVYDPNSLLIRFAVPELDMPHIRAGGMVEVTLDAYPGQTSTATIVRIYPELERATRTVMVEAELHERPKLFSGMFARIATPVRHVSDALVIPASALVVLPNGEKVVFVLQDGSARMRSVAVALEAEEAIALEHGVAAGELVITRGHEELKDGVAVQVQGAAKTNAAARTP